VNLDGIWSRAPSTISSVKSGIMQLLQMWKELHVTPELPALGPWPLDDPVGFRLALAQLKQSQKQGFNRLSHTQYDTIRRLRTSLAHVWESSAVCKGPELIFGFKNLKGDAFRTSNCPMESRWFSLFNRGLLLRMGRQTETNFGLDYRVLGVVMLKNMEREADEEQENYVAHRRVVLVGCFLVIAFVCALRGNEGFMVDAGELRNHFWYGSEQGSSPSHVVIPLLGRFKNEEGERLHLMVSVSVTGSGLKVRYWVDRWLGILRSEGRSSGPAFCNMSGTVLESGDIDGEFHNQLRKVQEARPDLLDPEVDVEEKFRIFRSLRRGSNSRAVDMKVPESVIDLHNRWRSMERRGGQRAANSMRDYYTDLALTLNSRLEYSQCL